MQYRLRVPELKSSLFVKVMEMLSASEARGRSQGRNLELGAPGRARTQKLGFPAKRKMPGAARNDPLLYDKPASVQYVLLPVRDVQ